MRTDIGGEGIDVLSVVLFPLTFDGQTQARLNQLQQQVAQTRIAQQAELTNAAQAKANAELTSSTSTVSLQQQCLTDLADMVKNGQTVPVGFNCGLGSSGVGGVIVSSTAPAAAATPS